MFFSYTLSHDEKEWQLKKVGPTFTSSSLTTQVKLVTFCRTHFYLVKFTHTQFIHTPLFIFQGFIAYPKNNQLVFDSRISSVGRALHQYRKGLGFVSLKSLIFFRLHFLYCSSSVHNCEDHLYLRSLIRCSNI